ncbi:hypothetical protein [Pseudomonas nitroreducens]|uniref:hypothetical protein n=1 Tax=Pseudomonas nitroreducens TaxID=46680 RepID=UPI000A06A7A6|nr:hypothetical protein [Pseudomonas nitroreducens]NMZ58608.1 hypothetical protein [Pseudomonas nitroreducens]SNS22007.1 hypothetical protein SAMN05216209_1844 [Pseudomonas nitroreducens]
MPTDATFCVSLLFALLTCVGIPLMCVAHEISKLANRNNRSLANQVQGRRTGLSERAFPFGQTERRAKRTLDRPPP